MNQPQFKIGSKITVFVGNQKTPVTALVANIYHDKNQGICYCLIESEHKGLNISQADLLGSFDAKLTA